jgi:hypothetical protein
VAIAGDRTERALHHLVGGNDDDKPRSRPRPIGR